MKSQTMNRSARSGAPAPAGSSFILHPSSFLILLVLTAAAVSGCSPIIQEVGRNIILPEQRTIERHDPAILPPARIPDNVPPRTVTNTRPDTPEWQLSLDDAIRISLENARVVRVLAGTTAVASGQTIYDPAISNTTIDQEQARFDPAFKQNNLWSRTNTPLGTFDPLNPFQSIITSTPTDSYQSTVGLTKTNVLGGQWGLNYVENPMRFGAPGFPLNPQQTHTVELSYTQPLLQGAGFQVNTAPIVIARLNTEQSYFQYKDSVQEMVRGVIEAYWNLVQARIDAWARKIQADLSEETYKRISARFKTGLDNRGNEAQARVTYNQFRANLIAAEANVLTREGALRNLLGLPPNDDRRIVPTSVPTERRLAPTWDALVRLSEQRRPDIVELKLIVEADKQRLLQAENQALPRFDAVGTYRWNGLSGDMPNGERLATAPGQFADWSIGVNFSVPLGLRQERAKLRQQSLLITRDQANVEEGVHAAVHQLASSVRDLDSSYDQYLAFKETRAAAFDNLQYQIGQSRVGLVLYLSVLQALNDWGTAVSSEAQQLLAYNVLLATLERQTGTILETHGLVFNEERFRAAGPIPCHDRCYPEALAPVGSPHLYPGTGEPAENAFDLKKPDLGNIRPPEKPPAPVPVPTPVPAPIPMPAPVPDRPNTPARPPEKQPVSPAAPPAPPAPDRLPELLQWPGPARPMGSSLPKH